MFINRRSELNLLEEHYQSRRAELFVLYGRRRVGKTDAEISQMLYISQQTIRRTRQRFAQEGLQAALEDKPHPATGSELDEKQEARIIAFACSEPPAGQARWSC